MTRDWNTFLAKGIDLDNDIEIPLIDFDPKPKKISEDGNNQDQIMRS